MKNIKNYDEFEIGELFESINNPYNITLEKISNDKYIIKFNNDKFLIEILDLSNGNDCWFYKFYRFDDNKNEYVDNLNPIENKNDYGESTKILGTVKKAFEDFINFKNPNGIYFIAYDKSKSRKSIYDLFLNGFTKIHKEYIKDKFYQDDAILYCLYKNKIYSKIMRKTVFDKYGILF